MLSLIALLGVVALTGTDSSRSTTNDSVVVNHQVGRQSDFVPLGDLLGSYAAESGKNYFIYPTPILEVSSRLNGLRWEDKFNKLKVIFPSIFWGESRGVLGVDVGGRAGGTSPSHARTGNRLLYVPGAKVSNPEKVAEAATLYLERYGKVAPLSGGQLLFWGLPDGRVQLDAFLVGLGDPSRATQLEIPRSSVVPPRANSELADFVPGDCSAARRGKESFRYEHMTPVEIVARILKEKGGNYIVIKSDRNSDGMNVGFSYVGPWDCAINEVAYGANLDIKTDSDGIVYVFDSVGQLSPPATEDSSAFFVSMSGLSEATVKEISRLVLGSLGQFVVLDEYKVVIVKDRPEQVGELKKALASFASSQKTSKH